MLVDARQIAAERVERERPGGRRRLDDVQPLPAPVEAGLDRVPARTQVSVSATSVTLVLKSDAVFGGDPSCW